MEKKTWEDVEDKIRSLTFKEKQILKGMIKLMQEQLEKEKEKK